MRRSGLCRTQTYLDFEPRRPAIVGSDAALAGFDACFDDGQAQAGTAGVASTRRFRPEEWSKDFFERTFGQSRSMVGNRDYRFLSFIVRGNRDRAGISR